MIFYRLNYFLSDNHREANGNGTRNMDFGPNVENAGVGNLYKNPNSNDIFLTVLPCVKCP